jgi:hypothetical protein
VSEQRVRGRRRRGVHAARVSRGGAGLRTNTSAPRRPTS